MSLCIKLTPILLTIFALVNCVAADAYYIGPTVGGVLGLIILILDIIAAIEILRSSKSMVEKLLWILFIFLFPVVGLIVYLLCGRVRSTGI